jgi:hypothetical protein
MVIICMFINFFFDNNNINIFRKVEKNEDDCSYYRNICFATLNDESSKIGYIMFI